eukprot:m.38472 g.38472  ORF g.38472 m.38472 type:complete len:78 (-) comp7833_c0_seq1:143-376(-)
MPNSATEGLLEQQSCQTRLQIPHGEPRVDRELSLSRGIGGRDIFAKVFPCCLKLWNPIARGSPMWTGISQTRLKWCS